MFSVTGQDYKPSTQKAEIERTNAYARQLENYLKLYLVDQYDQRAANAWHRDYSSIDAFERSVESNRAKWKSVVIKPPVLIKSGPLNRRLFIIEGIQGEWIELPLGAITAQAFLAFPAGTGSQKKVPIVIVQHGISTTPESPFRIGASHEYAKELLNAGFAVLVPMNLMSIERYVSFLVTPEDYIFLTGWLTEFTDHDVVSLICPRPLLLQHGKRDLIAWWPQVMEEFNIARNHYEKLKIEDRIQIDMHEGVHEAIIESGIKFMTKWIGLDSNIKSK